MVIQRGAQHTGVSAIAKFYEWGLVIGRIERSPVPYSMRTVQGVQRRVNDLIIGGEGPAHLRFTTMEAFGQWCDLGLGYASGRLPRMGSRNLAFAFAALSSGLRRAELGSILTVEVGGGHAPGLLRCWLGVAAAKWGSARWFYLSDSAVARVNLYIVGQRRAAVDRANKRGLYCGDEWIRVDRVSGAGQYIKIHQGQTHRLLSYVPIAERARLVCVGDDGRVEPMSLWLGENGLPFSIDSWNGVFGLANRKLAAARGDEEVWITPHVLRHTFATNMLGVLVGTLLERRGAFDDPQMLVLRDHLFDPLRELMKLMGHRSLETTHRYLHTLAIHQEAVQDAVARYGELIPVDAIEADGTDNVDEYVS